MTVLDATQVEAFRRDGFVVVPDLLATADVALLLDTLGGQHDRIERSRFEKVDAEGRPSRLSIWSDLGDDVFSSVSRHERLVGGARALLDDDVYHWHSKVMFKEAGGGGQWEWHQDYGYWYEDRCLAPRMLSVMVALDAATRENGCLKVLVGSHHLGRLDHGLVGDQAGIDAERVRAVESRLDVRYLEAEPGTGIFFHCNTLHSSEPNLSDRPRRAMICAYNALSNAPYDGSGPPAVPIRTVDRVGEISSV